MNFLFVCFYELPYRISGRIHNFHFISCIFVNLIRSFLKRFRFNVRFLSTKGYIVHPRILAEPFCHVVPAVRKRRQKSAVLLRRFLSGKVCFRLIPFFLRQHRAIRQEVSDRIFSPIQSLENEGILYVFQRVKKASQSLPPAGGKGILIIFCRGVYLTENSTQAASVRFVRQRRTNRARGRLQSFCQKRAKPLFDSLESCMYFWFFKLKKWGKKAAETHRRNCTVLP